MSEHPLASSIRSCTSKLLLYGIAVFPCCMLNTDGASNDLNDAGIGQGREWDAQPTFEEYIFLSIILYKVI